MTRVIIHLELRAELSSHYAVVNYDLTSIWLRFDAHSTVYQRSQWHNTDRWPASRSHADLFIFLGRSAAAWSWCRSSSGRSTIELQSNRSCNHRLRVASQLAKAGMSFTDRRSTAAGARECCSYMRCIYSSRIRSDRRARWTRAALRWMLIGRWFNCAAAARHR